jgi:threonine-phosphate decarboxylase
MENGRKQKVSELNHKHGGDIYSYHGIKDFSANINDRGMPPAVRLAAVESADTWLHYPDPQYRLLRKALAERENVLSKKADAKLDDAHIICGNGAAELMFSLSAALQPKAALLAAPSFFEYEQALASVGCRISRFHLQEEEGFTLTEAFLGAIDAQTDLIILGNPNNPTGQVIPVDVLRRLFEICQKNGIFLVLDESFFDFLTVEDRARTVEGVQLISEYDRLMVLKSFTKMYAMPGLRFGYGICSDQMLLARMREKMQPWNVSSVAEAAAREAAAQISFAEESAKRTEKHRTQMKRWMEEAGYRVFPSDTNFLLFRGPQNLQNYCIDQGYLIRDCSNFPGLEDENGERFFRVCVRSEAKNKKLCQVLQSALEQQSVLHCKDNVIR